MWIATIVDDLRVGTGVDDGDEEVIGVVNVGGEGIGVGRESMIAGVANKKVDKKGVAGEEVSRGCIGISHRGKTSCTF